MFLMTLVSDWRLEFFMERTAVSAGAVKRRARAQDHEQPTWHVR